MQHILIVAYLKEQCKHHMKSPLGGGVSSLVEFLASLTNKGNQVIWA